jgi:hypothetical protein
VYGSSAVWWRGRSRRVAAPGVVAGAVVLQVSTLLRGPGARSVEPDDGAGSAGTMGSGAERGGVVARLGPLACGVRRVP